MAYLFVRKREVVELHRQIIDTSGGSHGLRDVGMLESALAAAENRCHYEEASLSVCAATYAYHLTQAHAFTDGNKRIAAATAEAFLQLNRARLNATDQEFLALLLAVAASQRTRDEVETFFTHHTVLEQP